MIDSIRIFLKKSVPACEASCVNDEHTLQLATATLLMEVANADLNIDDDERAAIRLIVSENFSITPGEAATIAEKAEHAAGEVTSLFPFTRLITAGCSMEERIEIVSMLWKVTTADGHVDAHEEHLVRKIADLLYVPHSQFIRTKLLHQK